MTFIRFLFFPFSVIYGWMMQLRNRQFDNGQRPQVEFEPLVISVGNLSTGGTGKTPMVEFIVRRLKDSFKLVTLSRGYGRKTKGFRLAGSEDSASTIGDEPFQFYQKFKDGIQVAVGEERVLAIPEIISLHPETNLVLLDDAYQHRNVARDFNILLSDYHHPFYKDFVLPTGNLREPREGAKRADAIVVTKCPDGLDEQEKAEIEKAIRHYNTEAAVYFSHISYAELKPVFDLDRLDKQIVLLTGVAKAAKIAEYLSEDFRVLRHMEYPDHYNFRKRDLDQLLVEIQAEGCKTLVTTEKDMVRLLPFEKHPLFEEVSLFYLPIEFEIDRSEDFLNQIINISEGKER